MGRSRLKFWLPFLVLLAVVATGPFLWLPAIGAALVRDEGPAKADIAVVLAGDWYGKRILAAADLVRQGYAPAVLVSGPPYYDVHECDIAIQFAVRKGNPAEWFLPLPNAALSTREGSRIVLEELTRRQLDSLALAAALDPAPLDATRLAPLAALLEPAEVRELGAALGRVRRVK